jgi:hypothetical protein
MLIIVSAVASTVALLGALIVGMSTQKTIAGMTPKRDPGSVLVAFPQDIESQLKTQQMTSTGVAVAPAQEQPTADELAESLRDSLTRASGELVDQTPAQEASAPAPEAKDLAAQLEGLLLDKSQATDIAELRDYALRELTAQDGSIVVPDYDVSALINQPGLTGELASQISELQADLNEQIAALPELQGRQLSLQDIRLDADPNQLRAAINALGLQSGMLGLDFQSDSRYDSLQNLGEALLDGKSLEGLDMSELESISSDLLGQLNVQSGGETDQDID